MTAALLRYLVADIVRGQRWLAPVLVFLVGMTALDAGGGAVLPDYASTAALLLPVAIWLAIVAGNSEDPVQTAITTVTVGSALRVRLAKLAVAYAGCLVLTSSRSRGRWSSATTRPRARWVPGWSRICSPGWPGSGSARSPAGRWSGTPRGRCSSASPRRWPSC